MKTKLCRPILLPHNSIDTKLVMYHDGNFNHCKVSTNTDKLQYHTNQQLILISLDPADKIEVGDKLYYNGEIITFEGYDKLDSIWQEAVNLKQKVIATQDQLSPALIQQLVDEYNNGGMKDFEIEMEVCGTKDSTCGLIEHTSTTGEGFYMGLRPKLTNGFITVVEPERGITITNVDKPTYTEEDMNKAFDLGFQWSKTDMTEGPLAFLWRKLNK